MALAALLVVALVTGEAGPSRQARAYLGRPVAEVLQEIQGSGVRILFSSDLVPATLRVTAEPTSREPRRLAQQILAPHALTLAPGPRGTLLVVAVPRAPRPGKPRFDLEGAAVPAFPDWATRELGMAWAYDDPAMGRRVEQIVLHGSIEGLTPDEALAAVLPTCGLTFYRERGRIVITAQAERSGSPVTIRRR